MCSNHPTAPFIQKAGRNSKKVVLRNTLMYRLHDDVEDDDDGMIQVANDVPGRLPALNSRVYVGPS